MFGTEKATINRANHAVASSERSSSGMSGFYLQDNRAEAAVQRRQVTALSKGVIQRVVAPGLPFHTIVKVNAGPSAGRLVRILMPYTNPGNPEEKGYFTSDLLTNFQRSFLYTELDPVDPAEQHQAVEEEPVEGENAMQGVIQGEPVADEEEEKGGGAANVEAQDEISVLLADAGEENFEGARQAVQFAISCGANVNSLKITSSGGLSVTIIPKEGPVIYQVFRPDTFKELAKIAAQMQNGSDKLKRSVAMIQQLVPHLNLVVVDKITPLNAIFDLFGNDPSKAGEGELRAFIKANANKLAWDITNAIHELEKAGIVQKDVSIDNIGIRDGQFVLFDFDKAKSGDNGHEDVNALFDSISKRGGIARNKLDSLHANVLKRIQAIDETGDESQGGPFLPLQIQKLPAAQV